MKNKFVKTINPILIIIVLIFLLYFNFKTKEELIKANNYFTNEINQIHKNIYQRDSFLMALNNDIQIDNCSSDFLPAEKTLYLYVPKEYCWGCAGNKIINICKYLHSKINVILLCNKDYKRKLFLMKSEYHFDFEIFEIDNLFLNSSILISSQELVYIIYNPITKNLSTYINKETYDFHELLLTVSQSNKNIIID